MKIKPIDREPENGIELYFGHVPYSIDPKNMDKRVRVFITQLIPDIVEQIQKSVSIPDIMDMVYILRADYTRFNHILISKGMEKEADEVDYAMKTALVKITNKVLAVLDE